MLGSHSSPSRRLPFVQGKFQQYKLNLNRSWTLPVESQSFFDFQGFSACRMESWNRAKLLSI